CPASALGTERERPAATGGLARSAAVAVPAPCPHRYATCRRPRAAGRGAGARAAGRAPGLAAFAGGSGDAGGAFAFSLLPYLPPRHRPAAARLAETAAPRTGAGAVAAGLRAVGGGDAAGLRRPEPPVAPVQAGLRHRPRGIPQ